MDKGDIGATAMGLVAFGCLIGWVITGCPFELRRGAWILIGVIAFGVAAIIMFVVDEVKSGSFGENRDDTKRIARENKRLQPLASAVSHHEHDRISERPDHRYFNPNIELPDPSPESATDPESL